MKLTKLQNLKGSLFALMCVFSAIAVQAQAWTAPTLTGSAPVSGSQYYIYNVSSKGFLNRGGNWGTQAVVSAAPFANVTATVVKWTATNTSGSIWTFQYNSAGSNIANNYLFAANASSTDGSVYTDNATNNTWNVVQTDATNNIYSIQVSSTYAGYVETQYLGTSKISESTNKGIANPVKYNRISGDSTQWIFVSQADLDLYNAKKLLDRYLTYAKNKGVDITSFLLVYNAGVTADINIAAADLLTILGRTDVTTSITNPSFEDATAFNGWTNSGGFVLNNTTVQVGWTKDGTRFVEKWIKLGSNLGTGVLTQTLSGLANGLYGLVVSGQAFQQAGANPLHTGAYITAGSLSTEVIAGMDYTIDNISVTDGTLTIGYSLVAPVACNWTAFDNFKLYFYGTQGVTTGVNEQTSAATVYVSNRTLIVKGVDCYDVYTVEGKVIAHKVAMNKEISTLVLTPGVYIVKTDKGVQKVVVK